MRVMELYIDKKEAYILVKDTILHKAYGRTIFYGDNDMMLSRALEEISAIAQRYGVKKINMVLAGVGRIAYEKLAADGENFGFAVNIFDLDILVMR